MSDTIIRVENLSKKYQLSHARTERYTALRDVISDRARQLKSNILGSRKQQPSNKEDFWALKDVSFEIKRGDRVGIIGRNGAGKSTLLKILSRIVEPTSGSVELHGRVASLLEVGTGFHPELTGRENIFLNGAILGMSKHEISRKFDEIVSFAEIEKFLDTPVKRYSSGMYVRLAFSVAAHLEPEILIVDEVLAVGDIQFQRKCLGKMEETGRAGRTILFVSHQMSAISNLCETGLLVEQGSVRDSGLIQEVIDSYLSISDDVSLSAAQLLASSHRTGSGLIRITDFRIEDEENSEVMKLRSGKTYVFSFLYTCIDEEAFRDVSFSFGVTDRYGNVLFRSHTDDTNTQLQMADKTGTIRCQIHKLPLNTGIYQVGFRLLVDSVESDYVRARDSVFFEVEEGDYYQSGKQSNHAPFLVEHHWLS